MTEEEKEAIENTKKKIEATQKGLEEGKYYGERFNLEQNIKREKALLNYIEKLQKENKNADERNYSLGLDFIKIGEKLGLENFGIQSILLGIDKLQKENKELQKEKEKLIEANDKLKSTKRVKAYKVYEENKELKEKIKEYEIGIVKE